MTWKEISARYLDLTQDQAEKKLKEEGLIISNKIMSYDDVQINYYGCIELNLFLEDNLKYMRR
jgi:hypothetical protein